MRTRIPIRMNRTFMSFRDRLPYRKLPKSSSSDISISSISWVSSDSCGTCSSCYREQKKKHTHEYRIKKVVALRLARKFLSKISRIFFVFSFKFCVRSIDATLHLYKLGKKGEYQCLSVKLKYAEMRSLILTLKKNIQ